MASTVKSNTFSHNFLGRWSDRLLKLFVIVLLTMQPSIAIFGGGGSSSGGGGCGGSSGSSGSSSGSSSSGSSGSSSSGSSSGAPVFNGSYISSEVYNDYSGSAINIPAGGYTETLNGEDYIARLIGDASNRLDPRLPGYSYFQGLIQSANHITIAGQVRVVGGVMGADRTDATANLYGGAMVTTNAHAFLGAGDSLVGGPAGMRTRIRSMEEVPQP
jgi:hypothetical protein